MKRELGGRADSNIVDGSWVLGLHCSPSSSLHRQQHVPSMWQGHQLVLKLSSWSLSWSSSSFWVGGTS
eukprot:1682118-Pyramimonas_sp.AAC.1